MSAIRIIVLATAGTAAIAAFPGCAAPRSNAMPIIVVSPGAAQRIALMDQYRLHDEDRKQMMARPHVWVETVSEDAEETKPAE